MHVHADLRPPSISRANRAAQLAARRAVLHSHPYTTSSRQAPMPAHAHAHTHENLQRTRPNSAAARRHRATAASRGLV